MRQNGARLPPGWSSVAVSQILPFAYGKGLPKSERNSIGDVPVFGSSGIIGHHSEPLVEHSAIVVGRKGSVGAVYLSESPSWPIDTVFFSERTQSLNLRFLAHQLRFMQLGQFDQSTAIPSLSRDDLHAAEARLAPLPEQDRVVAEIEKQFSRLDAGVAALKRVEANLKRYKAAVLKAACTGELTADWRAAHPDVEPASKLLDRILHERRRKWEEAELAKMIAKGKPPKDDKWKAKYKEPAAPRTTDLPELPESWTWGTLGQIADIQGGIQKQPKRRPSENAYPYLRVANVFRGRLDLTDVHRIELFCGELERLRLERDDLLIVEGNGSKSEIGRCALWDGSFTDCVHQNHIIRARSLQCHAKFLDFYWNSPLGQHRVMEVAASTSGLYTLSVSKVTVIPVPIPPLSEQAVIIQAVEDAMSLVEAANTARRNSTVRASRLRQSILKDAFEGRLVDQDPTDEPASVLLERIRAERQQREADQAAQRKASPKKKRNSKKKTRQTAGGKR